MKKLICLQLVGVLILSCGHERQFKQIIAEKVESVKKAEGTEDTETSDSADLKSNQIDPQAGFLSEAETYAYFKSIAPLDAMWRYKNPSPVYSHENTYTFTEGYLLCPDRKQIGFVTLLCDLINHEVCNHVQEFPVFGKVLISEPLSGVNKQYDGYRIVREIKDGAAIDHLFKFDEKGHPILKDGPILHLTEPCYTRPPVSKEEATRILTENDRTDFRFDYSRHVFWANPNLE